MNQCFDIFHSYVLSNMDIVSPEKEVIIPSKKITREPWVTPGIKKSGLALSKLYKRAKLCTENDPVKAEYKNKRNVFNKFKRFAEQNYYKQKFIDFKDNAKILWKTI